MSLEGRSCWACFSSWPSIGWSPARLRRRGPRIIPQGGRPRPFRAHLSAGAPGHYAEAVGGRPKEDGMKRFSIAGLAFGLAMGLALGNFGQSREQFAFANAPYSEAKDFIYTLASGSFQRAAGLVSEDAGPGLSAKGLADTWTDLLKTYGNFRDLEVAAADINGDRWTV